jgi:hypothetical protein
MIRLVGNGMFLIPLPTRLRHLPDLKLKLPDFATRTVPQITPRQRP